MAHKVREGVLVTSPQSKAFPVWQSTCSSEAPHVHFDIYVFDVANPKEAALGAKPILVERGPYAYREFSVKHNVTFSADGDTVSYCEQKYFRFDPERSAPGLRPTDKVTTLSLPFIGLLNNPKMQQLGSWKIPVLKSLLCEVWKNDPEHYGNQVEFTPFTQIEVEKLAFGYSQDPLLSVLERELERIPFHLAPHVPTYVQGLAGVNISSPEECLRLSDYDTMFTGKSDKNLFGVFKLWRNSEFVYVCPSPKDDSSIPPACPRKDPSWSEEELLDNGWVRMWDTNDVAKVKGSDMIRWPLQSSDSTPLVFLEAIFRHSRIGVEDDRGDFKGVPYIQYGIREQDLENASIVPENAAYYSFGPRSLLNLTQRVGFPFFVSLPHFLRGDSRLRDGVSGLRPDKDLHSIFVRKNPLAGVSVQVQQALQLNAFYQNVKFGDTVLDYLQFCTSHQLEQWGKSEWDIPYSSDLEGIYFPLLWVNRGFSITKSQSDLLATAALLHDHVPLYVLIGGIVASALLVVIAAIIWFRNRRPKYPRNKSRDASVSDELFLEA